jgi:uncharacterized protein YegL
MDRKTPKSVYEKPEGDIGQIDILPAVKDLTKIYEDLAKKDKFVAERVQLLTLGPSAYKREMYLILTDAKPEEISYYQNIFGASQNETDPENFILHVSDAKQLDTLPLNYDSEKSRVYKIVQ